MSYPTNTSQTHRFEQRSMDRKSISDRQFRTLREMLSRILPENQFYARKLCDTVFANGQRFDWSSLENRQSLSGIPMTTKAELIPVAPSPFAANLTWTPDHYVRFHRTSGTHGHPMVVLDTAEDWDWWIEGWQHVLDVADINPSDRALMAFSFGPFIGFWSAFDAVAARGAMVIPTGSSTTLARLDMIDSTAATVLLCTPSYALHMAEVAAKDQREIRSSSIRKIIVAGEPGGSIAATRNRIESAWGAEVTDHCGASEIGPWGFADKSGKGIYVNENAFLPELISTVDQQPIPFESVTRLSQIDQHSPLSPHGAAEGIAELVLTTLGRSGSPVIRYRTGDLVRPVFNDLEQDGCQFLYLVGGVLGRTDDMMIIRGVNVFPTSVEAILREFPEVVEYRMTAMKAMKAGHMDQLKIEIESTADVTDKVQQTLNTRLGLRIEVSQVPIGTLPRFEAKAKRFVDRRGQSI